jgi:hypothetical protein
MKKFASLLIGLLLTLAGAAFAQQPEGELTPGKKQGAEKTHQAEPKTPKTRGENAAKSEGTAKQTGAVNEQGQGATGAEQGAGKGRKAHAKSETVTGTNVSGEPTASVAPGGKHQRGEKGMKAGASENANAKASPSVPPTTAASASAPPSVAATGQQNTNVNANASGGEMKKADPQKVQQVKQQVSQIKQQHASFRAQPRPDKVPPVQFSANYRIQGSERWSGPQYEVFHSYHPERHDRNWYHSRYQRVELIGGGYYYWNSGYWYPAWGYDPGQEYYAYDAPIYVGHSAEPPDRVIADVQAELQEMGYYEGEVDGLLGPLTREALAAYQADQGLTPTAMIDEPTLDSLQLG